MDLSFLNKLLPGWAPADLVLADLSVFGAGLFGALALLHLLTRPSERRPELADSQVNQQLQQYGSTTTIGDVRRGGILGGLGLAGALFALSGNVLLALPPAILGLAAPLLYPGWVQRRYLRQFEEGFAECLDAWARSLQAGVSLQQAIASARQDLSGPAANEMALLLEDIRLGDIDEALRRMYRRVPVGDVRYAVLGVITCRQTGGRISEVVTNIAAAIRERAAQRERITAITSMGRTEAYVMAVMPVGVGTMMYLIEPSTTRLLFTNIFGIIGTLAAAAWEGLGLFIIWKIVDIKA